MSGRGAKAARRTTAAPAAAAGRAALLDPVVELDETERRRLFRRDALLVIAGAVLFAVVFSLLSWLKYRAYMDARFDLGNMVQAVYNTAQGRFLEITTGEVTPRQISRLGSHVDPILALFAIPWLVWPSPVMLLVGQATIVATGAWPAYRLGCRITRHPDAGALLAGAFLLYPALGFLVLNEFHPVALATPLLLWAFLYLEEDRWLWALPFVVLAAACKENVPLVIALMGVYFALRKRSWWYLLLTAAAALYFALAFWVIIPHFNEGQSAFVSRYGEYGGGPGEILRTALTRPDRVATDLLAADNLRYWLHLLWPFAFIPLLSPLTALIGAPELLLNGLSSTIYQRRIEFHYTALQIPFLYAAAVLGLMRLWRWLGGGWHVGESAMRGQRVRRETLALLVFTASLAAAYVLGPLPFSLPGAGYDGAYYARTGHDAVLDEAVALIPDDAAVSVNNNVGAQLSDRRVIYVFPYFGKADWVIVDERHPFFYDHENEQLHQLALGRLVLDPSFQSVYARDGVYVFKRIAPLPGAARGEDGDGQVPSGSPSPSSPASAPSLMPPS
jgi:uncharacterized membrane protein